MTRRARALDAAWAALLAAVILGPVLLRRGYALRGDMVFVPDQPWKDAWLGLDGATPRFVPGEAVVWLLTLPLPGDLVQKILLFGSLLAAGIGAARMVGDLSLPARWAATTVVVWNPWVLARLEIGQWPLLVGLAALPWVVVGVRRVREGEPGLAVVLPLAVSAVASPPSGLLALALAAVLCVGAVTVRRAVLVLGSGALLNLPWIVPALLLPHRLVASREQFSVFALQGESGLGPLASALSLGGIWKTSIVPPERTSTLVVGIGVLVAAVALLGLRGLGGAHRAEVRRLLPFGAGLLLLAVATSADPVGDALGGMAERVPALGLLRDSHRLLAPWALVLAAGLAGAVEGAVRRAVPGREAWRVLAATGCVLPALLLPSLALGAGGSLDPVEYPDEWHTVQALPPATTVVLPWHGTYRGYDWNDRRAVLDPAPRMFPGTVLIDDRHFLDGVELASEEPLLARVGEVLASGDPTQVASGLRALGVERVVLERGNGVPDEALPEGRVVHDGPGLLVVDLRAAGPVDALDRPAPGRAAVLAADAVAVVTLACWFVGSVTGRSTMVYRRPSSADGSGRVL